MRGRHRQNRYRFDYNDSRQVIVAESMTINNIVNNTHISHVINAEGCGVRIRDKAKRVRQRRNPELLRFYQSCGMLDRNKVMDMNDEQFLEGTVDVIRHSTHNVASNIRNAGHGMARVGRCACGFVENVFGVVAAILK